MASVRGGLWLAPKYRRGALRFSPGCCCAPPETCAYCTGPAYDIAVTISGVTAGTSAPPCSDCSHWNDTFILTRRADLDTSFPVGCVWYYCFDDPCHPGKKCVVILFRATTSLQLETWHDVDGCDVVPNATLPGFPGYGVRIGVYSKTGLDPECELPTSTPVVDGVINTQCNVGAATVSYESV